MSNIVNFFNRGTSDPDLQAGSRGLSTQEVVRRYFKNPAHVLVMLREVRGVTIENISEQTQIEPRRLQEYESGTRELLPGDLVKLSKFFGANLKTLMQALGAIRDDASAEPMGIAAQFGGQLTEEERLDLRKLVGMFAAGRHQRGE